VLKQTIRQLSLSIKLISTVMHHAKIIIILKSPRALEHIDLHYSLEVVVITD